MVTSIPPSLSDARHAIIRLVDAWMSGRTLVPLVGAGVSVEAGIPTLHAITRYMAKVGFYIDQRVYCPRLLVTARQKPRGSAPSQFIRDVSWPDFHDITDELWQWLDVTVPQWTRAPDAKGIDLAVQHMLLRLMAADEAVIVRRLLELKPSANIFEVLETFPGCVDSDDLRQVLTGNWKPLLGHLTSGDLDLSDALFQQLICRRQPGTAHRFLAFLTRLCGLQLILTINFDTLIENALQAEGFAPDVYAVSRDAVLPDPQLVRSNLAVVKLHGGTFGLRIGERLDYPLDHENRERFLRYLPPNGVLLVHGCSGSDRRVMDVVTAIANRPDAGAAMTPRVVWLHYEQIVPEPVATLKRRCNVSGSPDCIVTARVQDPAAFLVELFGAMSDSHPGSRTGYAGYPRRFILTTPSRDVVTKVSYPARSQSVFVFNDSVPRGDAPRWPSESSAAMADFCTGHGSTHTTIWIDLELHYTVEGVVATIIEQIRQFDTQLAPFALLDGKPEGRRTRARLLASRVFEALQRGRYILALDNVGAFGRQLTVHHGLSEGHSRKCADVFDAFAVFLHTLIPDVRSGGRLRDSFICLAVDRPVSRFVSGANDREVRRQHEVLRDFITRVFDIAVPQARPRLQDGKKQLALALAEVSRCLFRLGPEAIPTARLKTLARRIVLLLVAFRRPASQVALRKLIAQQWRRMEIHADSVDVNPQVNADAISLRVSQLLGALEQTRTFRLYHLEGGFYGLRRRVKNMTYQAFSEDARSTDISDIVVSAADSPARRASRPAQEVLRRIAHVAELAEVHDAIARYCYTEFYLASRDASIFLEFLYHRISSLRWLTKLRAVARANPRLIALAADNGTDDDGVLRKATEDTQYLTTRCVHDVNAVTMTLSRERGELVAAVDGYTLAACCEWLLHDDIPRLNAAEYQRTSRKTAELPTGRDDPVIVGAVTELRTEVMELLLAALRELGAVRELAAFLQERYVVHSSGENAAVGSERHSLCAAICRLATADLTDRAVRQPTLVSTWRATTVDRQIAIRMLLDAVGLAECVAIRGDRNRALQILQCVSDELQRPEIESVLVWLPWRSERGRDNRCGVVKNEQVGLAEHRFELQRLALRYTVVMLDMCVGGRDPWTMRGLLHSTAERVRTECFSKALKWAEDGIELLRETTFDTPERHLRYRCGLRTAKARALYLQYRFHEAYQELDAARTGITPATEDQRRLLAGADLHLAECLMCRADIGIQEYAEGSLPKRWNVAPLSKLLSPSGKESLCYERLYRARRDVVDTVATILRRTSVPRARRQQVLARMELVLTLWVASIFEQRRHPTAKPNLVQYLFKTNLKILKGLLCERRGGRPRHKQEWRAISRELETWKRRFSGTTIARILRVRHGGDAATRFAMVMRQSLSHWNDDLLASLCTDATSADRDAVLQKARERLLRAESLLERGAEYLHASSANPGLWVHCYELQAQLQVEWMLWSATTGPQTSDGGSRRAFVAEVFRRLTTGLRSIRHGMQVIGNTGRLGHDSAPEDWRERRLVRLWFEIGLLGLAISQIEAHRTGRVADINEMWKLWEYHNKSAGLTEFCDMSALGDFRTYLDVLSRLRPGIDSYSLRARAGIVDWIQQCIRLTAVQWFRLARGEETMEHADE